MNEVRHKLSQVEDLIVASRNSVERYRNTDKTINEIGKELNVNYILECRAQSIQGRTFIELQLRDAENNKHLWSEPFKREISLDNILKVQKEATLAVANDLKAVLELNEKEQIERTPTENLAAYNFFLLGKSYMNISVYSPDKESSNQAIFNAKGSFEQAIELDSTFSDALASLGSIYINTLYRQQFHNNLDKANEILDSGMVFLNMALLFDKENQEALRGKAAYYERIGSYEDAAGIWKGLSKYEEPSYEYYQNEAMRFNSIADYYATIESYLKYLQLKPEKRIQPPHLLRTLIYVFRVTGCHKLERQLAKQLLDFNNDSVGYFTNRFSSEIYQQDFNAALKYALDARRLDSTDSYLNLCVAIGYVWLKDFSNALHYLVVSEDLTKQAGATVRPRYISGYIYHMTGYETLADYHLTGAIKRRQKEIVYVTPSAQQYYSHFHLASICMSLGDEEKALEYLTSIDPPRTIDFGYINILNNWPGFDSIRQRPEFLKVLEHLDDRYQKQYRRIGKLMKDLEFDLLQNTAS
jgi:tetratricopeptide (TPR) repeat protein